MESHILNSYHQARYRTIGHKTLRAKSDSLSSESSNQNSPEYTRIALQRAPYVARAQSEDSTGEEWGHNQTMNTTQSSQDTSSDDETEAHEDVEQNIVVQEYRIESDDEQLDDNIVVQEITVDDEDESVDVDDESMGPEHNAPVQTVNGFRNFQLTDSNSLEENTLVEGHDYDVITVYTVNPDLDLIEASSDDEWDQQDYAIPEKEQINDGYLHPEDNPKYKRVSYVSESVPDVSSGIDLNLDTPVVSNVDEYFIKEKDLLQADEPVVKDVDEYFIKDKGKESKRKESITVPNVDDFFIKHKLPEEDSTRFHIPDSEPIRNVDEFLVIEKNIKKEKPKKAIKKEVVSEVVENEEIKNEADVSINESDFEVLPNIEDLKRYLLEEMTYTKFKNIQRSCSLPQSPMQNICMDIDDAKTCLSFEDLNLDLSDLAFDSDKGKSDTANKSDDIPRTLTEEDVNSFLITNQTELKSEKDDDDLDPQDMEIEGTIESPKIEIIPPAVEDPFRKLTSTPILFPSASTKVLDFCIEKTPVKTEELLSFKDITPIKKEHPVKKELPIRKEPPSKKDPTIKKELSIKKEPPIKKELPIKKEPPIRKEPPPKAKLISINPTLLTGTKPNAIETKTIGDMDDFVDVESCNDTVIPVLEANNLSSLLEQFEASEKLNKSKKPSRVIAVTAEEQKKPLSRNTLTNGMRLQDAGVQLNKNKMRQILMPSTINTAIKRSPSPVHSDHDYCSSKKRHSLANLKGGQSLLKPEVLSSNSRILSSRHRTCKNKKIVYNLSSDDESETKAKNKKVTSDSELKKKTSIKPAVKPPAQSNCRKKLSPTHSVSNDVVIKDKSNNSVINKSASKASDTPCSQNSNASIKLTIKNKSEVILNCDHKDSQKDKHNNNIEKCKSSSSVSDVSNIISNVKQEKNIEKNIKEVDRNKNKHVNNVETVSNSVSVKEETRPKDENFYTALFSNKQDLKMPQVQIKTEKRAFEDELNRAMEIKKEEPRKKKLNLQEYKLRKGASSNNSSTTVSPEAIFPEMPHPLLHSDKTAKPLIHVPVNGIGNSAVNGSVAPKKIFDPIREASRKILMNTKKQKAEATRKRDEDIVMRKIPKVENLQLQPLISDAEMMKIVGMSQPEVLPIANEKPQLSADYVEIILVSVGTNTDENMIKKLEAEMRRIENSKRKSTTPPIDPKSHINFKIKKSDHILKQNVFDAKDKRDKRSPIDDKKHSETKIDKERFKDITATLKSVGKQVDNRMSSNSLFASIQDVVMKKAPDEQREVNSTKLKSPVEKREVFKFGRPIIVRDYDTKADHGEDKVILHLGRHRSKPSSASIVVQTDPIPECPVLSKAKTIAKEKSSVNRRRNDSDMSMSSESHSPVRNKETSPRTQKIEDSIVTKSKTENRVEKRSQSKEKQLRSDRYEPKYRRRSRSLSRSRRRRRSISRSRSRSRSRGRYRRTYRRSDRSDSPYKRKRRSRSRSYHKRRSPSKRRERRSNRTRSRSRAVSRSKSPAVKKARQSPQKANERKCEQSMTPPLRKPTVSESSDSSTSSSSSSSTSSSSSSSSDESRKSRGSRSSYQKDDYKKPHRSYSSEDRENNTPVEERRIVFVGKLEKDVTQASLRGLFSKFGPVIEVRLHTKEDGSRYGFVTYQNARDAWTAVEQAAVFPQYDVGFGGRRAFCRQSYADLDGLEAKYTESAFHGAAALPVRRTQDMSFEQMLHEMKKKLSQRKSDKKHDNP